MIERATPTIDTNRELAAPKWREETHQLPVLPSTVDIKATVPRPLTHQVDHQMRGRPINYLAVRQSNINPAMAGVGDESSVVAVSNDMLPGMGAPAEGANKTLLVLAAGAGIGYLLWKMSQGGLVRI